MTPAPSCRSAAPWTWCVTWIQRGGRRPWLGSGTRPRSRLRPWGRTLPHARWACLWVWSLPVRVYRAVCEGGRPPACRCVDACVWTPIRRGGHFAVANSHAPRLALMVFEWRHPLQPFLPHLPPLVGGGAGRSASGLHAGPCLPGAHQGGGGAAAGTAGRSSWPRGRRCCRCRACWGRPGSRARGHCYCSRPPCPIPGSTVPALHNLSPHVASTSSVPHGACPPWGWHSATPSDGRPCPCHPCLQARRGPRGPAGGGCRHAGPAGPAYHRAGPAYRRIGPACCCPQQRSSSSRNSGVSRH